ncbi:MAG TPA: AbrB/MazE/SpoVT family DNA-binding domain-containing protein [Candidatus Saccharimonadales bacterium]|jgi:antitoxin MazE
MNITQSLQKWGNGTGVRIPKKVMQAAHLELNQSLIVSLQGTSIVLTPLDEPEEVNLSTLLKGVTPALVNGEMEWGHDVGAERYE